MQKVLVAAAVFVIGAAIGMGLLAVVIVVAGVLSVRHSGGIGAVAGGVGHWTVLVVPVACGSVSAWLAVRRMNRIQG
jgi:hypothetical protein